MNIEIKITDEICDQGCCFYAQYSVYVDGLRVNDWCDEVEECLELVRGIMSGKAYK